MLNYKNGKWASEIIALQQEEGHWGCFHTLSYPAPGRPITTEQALRRLRILGFTKEDTVIAKALSYMHSCLSGENVLPDRREKTHDWDIFTELMLSTWIRKFTQEDLLANHTADKWSNIIHETFKSGKYSCKDYENAYYNIFGRKPKGGRLVDFITFYQISLLGGKIGQTIEKAYFTYITTHKEGIYYIYGQPVCKLPKEFESKDASRYLSAVELLCEYPNLYCRELLKSVADWLRENRKEDGNWDMGSSANDGVYFPLSDSWRKPVWRIQDCTGRISKILFDLDQNQIQKWRRANDKKRDIGNSFRSGE